MSPDAHGMDIAPGFRIGYYEGWADARAGRQYGQGVHGRHAQVGAEWADMVSFLAAAGYHVVQEGQAVVVGEPERWVELSVGGQWRAPFLRPLTDEGLTP